MEITIFEGARGTGKSTLVSSVRQRISGMTSINFTGFHDDGLYGLLKVSDYYDSWMRTLYSMSGQDIEMVFDRFYFSEAVYSKLYKSYDFSQTFNQLNNRLETLTNLGVKINIIFLTIDDKGELKNRLMRDKVPFGNAEESVIETLKQQEGYRNVFEHIKYAYGNENLQIHTIDTSNKSNEEVYAEALEIIKPLN